jgi:hypothetical protein
LPGSRPFGPDSKPFHVENRASYSDEPPYSGIEVDIAWDRERAKGIEVPALISLLARLMRNAGGYAAGARA